MQVVDMVILIRYHEDKFNLPVASSQSFIKWLVNNSKVYFEFEKYAVELKVNGNRKIYSARTIIERLRWDSIFLDDDSVYKINNNYVPHMSRLAMMINTSLEGMFELRG